MSMPLSPASIARPLDVIETWRLPDAEDLAALHRGVVATLGALDALCQLELPLDMPAPGSVRAPASMECELVRGLLANAERCLAGAPHRLRIERLWRSSPGQAMQLERLREAALGHLAGLRRRLDFIRDQFPTSVVEYPAPPAEAARPAHVTLQ